MKTPKISVWAFNEFHRFDALISVLGCAQQEPGYDYHRTNQVKMVNTDHHFKHTLDAFLTVSTLVLDETEVEDLRDLIFKKSGGLRKLEGKEVKFKTDGLFIVIEF